VGKPSLLGAVHTGGRTKNMIEILGLLGPALNSAVQRILEKGFDSLTDTQGKNLQAILRERLKREVRFNSELLSESGISVAERLEQFDLRAIEFLFSQPLPLKSLFPRELSDLSRKKIAGGNQKHKKWIDGLSCEADVIERAWLRMSIAKFRVKNRLSLGDTEYLRHLVIGLSASLAEID
jgi:hypothetical protein